MAFIIDASVRDFLVPDKINLRKALSDRILAENKNLVPVIIGRATRDAPHINKHKFLIPETCTYGMFLTKIRQFIPGLKESETLFSFVSDNINTPPIAELMFHIYQKYKAGDGFLYVGYTIENTFG